MPDVYDADTHEVLDGVPTSELVTYSDGKVRWARAFEGEWFPVRGPVEYAWHVARGHDLRRVYVL